LLDIQCPEQLELSFNRPWFTGSGTAGTSLTVLGFQVPEQLERGVRGWGVALRAVQLGRPPPRQCQGDPQARQGQVRESQVRIFLIKHYSLFDKLSMNFLLFLNDLAS